MKRGEARAVVVYEDARSGNQPFGLHRVLTALVSRRIGLPPHEVAAALRDLPAGGASKLAAKLCADYAPRGEAMLVWLDGDRAAEQFGCKDDDADITRALARRAEEQHGRDRARTPQVFVLRLATQPSNTEGLLQLIKHLAPACVDASVFRRAIDMKKPADRDDIFLAFSRAAPELHEALLRDVPTLRALVERAAVLVSGQP